MENTNTFNGIPLVTGWSKKVDAATKLALLVEYDRVGLSQEMFCQRYCLSISTLNRFLRQRERGPENLQRQKPGPKVGDYTAAKILLSYLVEVDRRSIEFALKQIEAFCEEKRWAIPSYRIACTLLTPQ